MDFVADGLIDGRKPRCLAIVADYRYIESFNVTEVYQVLSEINAERRSR
jgi:hypothetical protein